MYNAIKIQRDTRKCIGRDSTSTSTADTPFLNLAANMDVIMQQIESMGLLGLRSISEYYKSNLRHCFEKVGK